MGIFGDAGIDVSDIPNDPYGFGKEHWPVEIIEASEPDVSKSGKQYGTILKWKCLDPAYSYMQSLGGGQWLQLPPPLHVLETIPAMEWDPKDEKGRQCIFRVGALLTGLGIPVDQLDSVEIKDLKGMRCMAKIFPKMDGDFWKFSIVGHKPMPAEGSAEAMAVFAKGGASGNSGGGNAMDAMEAALAAEMESNKK